MVIPFQGIYPSFHYNWLVMPYLDLKLSVSMKYPIIVMNLNLSNERSIKTKLSYW